MQIADHCVSAVVAPSKLNARTLAVYNPGRNGLETCENMCNISIKAELCSLALVIYLILPFLLRVLASSDLAFFGCESDLKRYMK